MSERVRWGVLGCASIAVNNVIPAMQRSERCTVTAIASRDGARAAAIAAQLGIPRHHGSDQDLVDDPEVEHTLHGRRQGVDRRVTEGQPAPRRSHRLPATSTNTATRP